MAAAPELRTPNSSESSYGAHLTSIPLVGREPAGCYDCAAQQRAVGPGVRQRPNYLYRIGVAREGTLPARFDKLRKIKAMDCHPNCRTVARPTPPLRLLLVAIAVSLYSLDPARGQSPDIFVDVQDRLQQMQQQIDRLETEVQATQQSPSTVVYCPPPKKEPEYPTVRITGLIQADVAWFHQDAANRNAIVNGSPLGDIQDGIDIRRARIGATGRAWDNVRYLLEMDFGLGGRPTFMDNWLDIDQVVGSSNLRVGYFRQPFGMDGQTSIKELRFLERALPFAILPFRQTGLMLYGSSDEEVGTWAVSAFRFPTGPYAGNIGDNGGYGLAARGTTLLINHGDGQGVLHLGGGYSYIDPANDAVRYRSQPEISVSESGSAVPLGVPSTVPVFVDTGVVPTADINQFNVELAASHGAWYAQSEMFYSVIDQLAGPTVTLPSGYAQVAYTLTGEHHPYKTDKGVFGRVRPQRSVGKEGGIGAWELAARWSYLDLTDQNIRGGRLNNVTLGVNWYLNPYTKFQFNYIRAALDDPTGTHSVADITALRAQVDF